MTHWAIGDVQGCADALQRLLDKLALREQDRLWFVGDLVNRGEDSLAALRQIKSLCETGVAQCVLGNHDLHLLAVASGAHQYGKRDSIAPILQAADRDALLDWLRHQPLLITSADAWLVHAGLHPSWNNQQCIDIAANIEAQLRSDNWQQSLNSWLADTGQSVEARQTREQLDLLINMRLLDADQHPVACASGPPADYPQLRPWFELAAVEDRPLVVFGHYAALGYLYNGKVLATDTGCVWGGRLTAFDIANPTRQVSVVGLAP